MRTTGLRTTKNYSHGSHESHAAEARMTGLIRAIPVIRGYCPYQWRVQSVDIHRGDRPDDAEGRDQQADRGADEMIHAFACQRIQPHPRNVAAHEAAGVRGVVNSRHDEAEHAHRQRIAERFGAYEAAAAA